MTTPMRILYVDDNPMDRDLVRHALEQEPGAFSLIEAATREQFESLLEETCYDVILSDFNILGFEGLEVIEAVQAKCHRVPVIIVTGTGSEEVAVEAMKRGAADYVIKTPRHIKRLPQLIQAVLERKRLEKQHEQDERMLKESEERFRLLYEHAPIGYQSLDENGLFLEVNRAWVDLLGYSRDEVIGKWFGHFVAPAWEEHFEENFPCFKAAGEIRGVQFEMVRKDGSTIIVEFDGKIGYDRRGNFKQTHCILRDITEQRRAEAALLESEERFRATFEQAAVGIAHVAPDGSLLRVNQKLCDIVGYSREELLTKTFQDITYPADLESDLENVRQVLADQIKTYSVDKRYIRKDGSPVWIRLTVSLVRNAAGAPDYFISIVRDITQRKRSEEAQQESEERFRLAFENANIGVCLVDIQGRFLQANDQICEIWGYSQSELQGMTVNDITHPEDLGLSQRFIERARAGKIDRDEFEKRYIHKQGYVVRGRVSSSLARDKQGNPLYFISHVQDITDRERAQQVQRRLATAIEQATEGVIITNTEGTIEYVNPGLEQMTGYSRDELIGQTPRILKSGEQDTGFYRQLWDTIKAGNTWSGQFINRRKDGRLYHEDATITPVKDASGKIVNFVAVKRDITQHLELSKQLFQAQKMEAVGTLAGGVAHDFNNLLQVVLGYSELILSDENLPANHRNDLAKVNQAARNGADLVQRLLTFSRKTEIKPLPLSLNRRIEQLQKMLTRTIPKMIEIELNLADNLSAINADPTQVDQILMNLAVNARDAMPEGGKLVIETTNKTLDEDYASVHLGAKPGVYVLLSVSDTGQGMDKETLQHIFEPFYTTKGPGVGTGLGLAMVYGIVQQHRGYIMCYSEPGAGTTFKIYFPAIISDEESWEVKAKMPTRGGSETILLVDDEELIRDLGSRILSKAGYKVVMASNGKDALEVYQAQRDEIALVMLDLIMPEMGGKHCLEGLLRFDPAVKVVIATGFAADGQTKGTLAAGAKGFVNKPYDIRQVMEVVREVLDAE